MLGWIEHKGISPRLSDATPFVFYGVEDPDGAGGVAAVVAGCLAALSEMPAGLAQRLGAHLRSLGVSLRLAFGPMSALQPFWRSYMEAASDPGRILPQVLYHARPRDLRHFGDAPLYQAGPQDIAALLEASVAMHAEETGEELTREERDAFDPMVEEQVAEGRAWCALDPVDGRLLFKANTAMSSWQVVQLEGVWVPPALRQRGLARRHLAELCRVLLARHDGVSLYAHQDNGPARALYRRLGFRELGAFGTAVVGRSLVLAKPGAEGWA